MRRLRAPDGCPWDKEQTHESLRPYLIEEACEAVDAISFGTSSEITEELGDVLLQVAFHAVIAEETNGFSYEDIENSIVTKLIRRHPHIFDDISVSSAEEVASNWQTIKAAEKSDKDENPAERVPRSLPALMRAFKLGKKLNWPSGSKEAILQSLAADDVGMLLLSVVDYARSKGVDPEIVLRKATEARATKKHEIPQVGHRISR